MTEAPIPTAPAKKRLSTGAIVGIVLGSVALIGIIVLGLIVAVGGAVYNADAAKANDTSARVDASTLARDLQLYFIDNSTGDFTGSADGQNYTLVGPDGTITVPQSEGVEFGGISVSIGGSWCLWVYAPEGDQAKDGVEYSSSGGLADGSC